MIYNSPGGMLRIDGRDSTKSLLVFENRTYEKLHKVCNLRVRNNMPQMRFFLITRQVSVLDAKIWYPKTPLGMDSSMRAILGKLN